MYLILKNNKLQTSQHPSAERAEQLDTGMVQTAQSLQIYFDSKYMDETLNRKTVKADSAEWILTQRSLVPW